VFQHLDSFFNFRKLAFAP